MKTATLGMIIVGSIGLMAMMTVVVLAGSEHISRAVMVFALGLEAVSLTTGYLLGLDIERQRTLAEASKVQVPKQL